MIAIIFEVTPHDGKKDEYVAGSMRSLVEQVDGFISVERFQSPTIRKNRRPLLRERAAVNGRRQPTEHRAAQTEGRDRIFKDYRIRVLSVIRDYGMSDRTGAPADSLQVHDEPSPCVTGIRL